MSGPLEKALDPVVREPCGFCASGLPCDMCAEDVRRYSAAVLALLDSPEAREVVAQALGTGRDLARGVPRLIIDAALDSDPATAVMYRARHGEMAAHVLAALRDHLGGES